MLGCTLILFSLCVETFSINVFNYISPISLSCSSSFWCDSGLTCFYCYFLKSDGACSLDWLAHDPEENLCPGAELCAANHCAHHQPHRAALHGVSISSCRSPAFPCTFFSAHLSSLSSLMFYQTLTGMVSCMLCRGGAFRLC